MSECYVYIVAILRDGELRGPVKVGMSGNPWARLTEIQTGCPHQLRVAHAFWLPNREIALEYERHFHFSFPDKRLHGEWFDVSPYDAIDWIVSAIDQELFCKLRDVPLFLYVARKRYRILEADKILAESA